VRRSVAVPITVAERVAVAVILTQSFAQPFTEPVGVGFTERVADPNRDPGADLPLASEWSC